MNNKERELWVINDEWLWSMWKASGLSKRDFIYRNRSNIDSYISSKIGR